MISEGFKTFMNETPNQQEAWSKMVSKMNKESDLEEKTKHLCYLAVLASAGLLSGIPFHTTLCKKSGASREEVISSVLIGLPAVGSKVIAALPVALDAYDGVNIILKRKNNL